MLPVVDHGGDVDVLLDDAVVGLGYPDADRRLGVPAGDQLVQEVLDGPGVPVGDGFSSQAQPLGNVVPPGAERPRRIGLGFEPEDSHQEVGVGVMQ